MTITTNTMKAHALALLLAATLGIAKVGAQTLSDDFSTLNTSTWTAVTSTGTLSSNVYASGGLLNEKVGSASASHRSYLLSQSTAFDPFTQALSFTFSGLTLGGTPSGAEGTTGWVAFYAMVGLTTSNASTSYYVGGGGGGDYLAFQLLSFTNGYELKVSDYNGTTAATTTYFLNGAPTGITWTIDGLAQTYSFTLAGTTFTATGLATGGGTLTNFNAAGLAGQSELAFGTVNGSSNVTAAATATLDSLSVSVVPEPGTMALLLGAAGLVLWRRRAAWQA